MEHSVDHMPRCRGAIRLLCFLGVHRIHENLVGRGWWTRTCARATNTDKQRRFVVHGVADGDILARQVRVETKGKASQCLLSSLQTEAWCRCALNAYSVAYELRRD